MGFIWDRLRDRNFVTRKDENAVQVAQKRQFKFGKNKIALVTIEATSR